MTAEQEARRYWIEHVGPAYAALRDVVKSDGTGIDAKADTVELGRAIGRMRDAMEEFELFTDDIGEV